MRVGVIGAGAVGAATVLSLIERGGMFRELVVLDRDRKRADGVATDMRSAAVSGIPVLDLLRDVDQPLDELQEQIENDIRYANITIIEGTGASQYGIGAVSARLAEAVLRDEGAVLPVAAYSPAYGVTLSLVSVLGAGGVQRMYEPRMTGEERAALDRSAEILREAARHILD